MNELIYTGEKNNWSDMQFALGCLSSQARHGLKDASRARRIMRVRACAQLTYGRILAPRPPRGGFVWDFFASDTRANAACRAAIKRAMRRRSAAPVRPEDWLKRNRATWAKVMACMAQSCERLYTASQENTPAGRDASQRHNWAQEDMERMASLMGFALDWPGIYPTYVDSCGNRSYITPFEAVGVSE